MSSNEELIDRSDVDDLEAILSITNTDMEEVVHAVEDNADAIFTWDYDRSRPALGKLYEKAKTSQWNAETDLDWSTDVDPEEVARSMAGGDQRIPRLKEAAKAEGSPISSDLKSVV